MAESEARESLHFIEEIVEHDLAQGLDGASLRTRFPPEPNGYLHIGHAKAICIDYGIAQKYGGSCNLRMDDTNPSKEDVEYVDAIVEDVRWLGFEPGQRLCYASDYFDQLYDYAERLIHKGKAFVCDLSAEEMSACRGTPEEPGRESPWRGRSVAENLDLFGRMRAGEFADGSRTLRARIDMASPNFNLRDPVMYRILRSRHHRTGDTWCIYPTYDWAHGQSDSIEGITHSLCTLEFEHHRPLYEWFLRELEIFPSRQIEFARLNVSHTITSKRKLAALVESGRVNGWDDPRLPTLRGMRRRGFTPEALRAFCERVGVTKRESLVDWELLEHHLRDDLNPRTPRVMGVLRPLRVVIENYPEGRVEEFDAPYFPDDPPKMGSRPLPFSRVLYIERDDFMLDPPKKFFRLAPGREVRLRRAYYITCTSVVKDERTGEIVEVRCKHDPASRGGTTADGRKVQGTLHWVSAEHSLPAEVRLYDRLFREAVPGERTGEPLDDLNPDSLQVLKDCRVERGLAGALPGSRYQLERLGYFCVDSDSKPGELVLNRTVALRDSWAKIAKEA